MEKGKHEVTVIRKRRSVGLSFLIIWYLTAATGIAMVIMGIILTRSWVGFLSIVLAGIVMAIVGLVTATNSTVISYTESTRTTIKNEN